MKIIKKMLLASSILALTSVGPHAHAAYPEHAIKIVVPFPPGSILDTTARHLANRASTNLGQSVVVENRPGATGNIGAAHVAHAAPDGYTLLMTIDTTLTVNPFVYSDVGYDPAKELTPIGTGGSFGAVLLAHPSLNISNFQDFSERAKSKNMFYSSGGIAAPGHLAFELLKERTGLQGTHVPYKGNAPALTALLGGEVDVGFLAVPGALRLVKANSLVPLMVPGNQRDPTLPNVPAAAEYNIQNFDTETAQILLTPAATPKNIIEIWEQELKDAFNDPAFTEKLAPTGLRLVARGSQETQQWMNEASERWKTLVQSKNIKLD